MRYIISKYQKPLPQGDDDHSSLQFFPWDSLATVVFEVDSISFSCCFLFIDVFASMTSFDNLNTSLYLALFEVTREDDVFSLTATSTTLLI